MKRTCALLLLTAALLAPWLALAQVPALRVIIVDPTGTHAAAVSGGNIATSGSASVTVDTISHITSAVHVAGIAQTVAVNCVTGCSASAGTTSSVHVSVALHVAGTINGAAFHIQGLGTPGQSHAGVLTIQGVAGMNAVAISGTVAATQSGAWGVNVGHVSAALHVAGIAQVVSVNCVIGCGASAPHTAVTMAGHWDVSSAQSGVWNVTAHQGGVWTVGQSATAWTIAHISSATHIVGTVTCTNCTGGSSDAINVFHQSTIRHISSVTHVYVVDFPRGAHVGAGQSGSWTIQAAHQGGAWMVNVGHIAAMLHVAIVDLPRWAHLAAAQSGSWTIQAAHQGGQWNIAHVNSVTHVVGNMVLRNVAGTAVTVTGTALDVNCTGCSAAASTAVTHVSAALHVAGTINGAQFHVQGLGIPGQSHGGVLTIQGVTGGIPVAISGSITAGDAINVFHQSTIRHISSVTHVAITSFSREAHLAAAQSGVWNVTAHQGGAWTNLMIAHISGAVHIGGTVRGAMFHVQGVGTPGQAHGGVFTVQGIGADATVTVVTNTAPFRVAHITGAAHVFVLQSPRDRLAMHQTDSICLTCSARVDHYNVLVVQPHISGAFRASRVNQCGSTTATVVPTNTNRRDLYIQNLGGQSGHSNVALGFGTTGHVGLTINNGWILHSMTTTGQTGVNFGGGPTSQLILYNYSGPLSCITNGIAQPAQLGIIEILR